MTPSGPNNRNGTATVITNINNQVTLIASVTTPNGVVTLNRQVTVGTPVPGLIINGVAPYGAIDATVTTDAPPPYKCM